MKKFTICFAIIAITFFAVHSAAISQTLVISGILRTDGNLICMGDFVNNGTLECNGKLIFKGHTPQTIKSNGKSFSAVIFDNSGNENENIILADDFVLAGIAEFRYGIVSPRENKFIFLESSTYTGGNSNSFVDGTVEKMGTEEFRFPTGNAQLRDIGVGIQNYKIYAPITIRPTVGNVSVRYYFSDEELPVWWYHNWSHEPPLTHTTNREYWLVNAASDLSSVRLHWEDNDPCTIHDFCSEDVPLLDALTVTYWDGIWKNAGGSASDQCHLCGSICSTEPIPFGTKSQKFITFGAKDSEVPLPIELLEFDVKCENNAAIINWSSASEQNNDYYIIENSADMKSFKELARINGAGYSNTKLDYEHILENVLKDFNYYRLTQVDYDGKYESFDIKYADCFNENNYITQINNYTENNNNIISEIYTTNNADCNILVYDINGVILHKSSKHLQKGKNIFILEDISRNTEILFIRITGKDFDHTDKLLLNK